MFSKFVNLEPHRRDALLNAALQEFAAKGYDGASTNVIAKNAGISKALMFHYVGSKKDLFLFLCDYGIDVIKAEYLRHIDSLEKDVFTKLRQAFFHKIGILHRHPWIFDFVKTAAAQTSDEIKPDLEQRLASVRAESFQLMFGCIDESKFRNDLDINRCRQIIFWSMEGFLNGILEKIKYTSKYELDFNAIMDELDRYLDELRKSFYA